MYKLRSLKIKNIISFKEQEFKFRNGKAILIVGQNLDDATQNGNGSGKSSLIESVALAFTGSSIRDVKTKELIHNNQESGEVDLTLFNTVTGGEFRIWRKIYSGTKSAEYKAWINGKEQADRYSDLNMFNAFVWDTIGISKDDFFSFFLITKENYTPFLLVGDTKKKEVINRFSGADKVDNALPHVDNDIESLKKDICDVEKELVQNQTRQQVIAEQIQEEEGNCSEEMHQELIQVKEEELKQVQFDTACAETAIEEYNTKLTEAQELVNGYDREATLTPLSIVIVDKEQALHEFDESLPAKLQSFKDEVEIAELEVETFEFSKDYQDEFDKITSKQKKKQVELDFKKAAIPKVKDQFSSEILSIKQQEEELQTGIKEAEGALHEHEAFESQINKQLQDAIECPKCSHKFSLRDQTFNYKEAVEKLPEVQEAIKDYKELIQELKTELNVGIQQQKEAVNAKILKAGEGIKSEIEELNKALVELGQKELAIKQEQQKELQSKRLLEDNIAKAKRNLNNKEQEEAFNRTTFENAVKLAKSEFEKQEKAIENDIWHLTNRVKQCELNLQRKEQELKSYQQQITFKQEEINKLKSQEVDRSKIEKLKKDIEVLIKAEDEINKRLDVKRKELEEVSAWEIHFKNFKGFLANKCLGNIEQFTNLFLQNMGSNLRIGLEGYRTLSNKKLKEQITTNIIRDGFDSGSYGKHSGGERTRIDCAVILSLQELILLNCEHGKGLDLFFADEILESVDVTGMESIITSLQNLGRTIMLVSQNDVNSLVDHTLIVQKKNKMSSIINNN